MKKIKKSYAIWITLYAFFLTFIVTTLCFIITPYQIIGTSMEPIFTDGQIVWINKLDTDYKYLDVIVFRSNDTTSIKRIIGVSGDRISIRNGKLYKNGIQLVDFFDNVHFLNYDCVLKTDEYYVVGDNYIVSLDSRNYGAIQKKHIIGKIL